VALNPVIKFTTLFGLLAVEIAVTMTNQNLKTGIGIFFFVVALIFVHRSFYSMRIPEEQTGPKTGWSCRTTSTARNSTKSSSGTKWRDSGQNRCPLLR